MLDSMICLLKSVQPFTDLGGQENYMQSYGLNKMGGKLTNSTSANNQSSRSKTGTVKGHQLTVED